VFGLILTALIVTGAIILAGVQFKLGRESLVVGCMVGLITGLSPLIARHATDWIFVRLGKSRRGKTLEIRGRTALIPEGEVADDDLVEIRRPESLGRGLINPFLVFGFLIALMLPVVPREALGYAYSLIAFFALFWLWCLWTPRRIRDRRYIRADSRGILGYTMGPPSGVRLIPWSEVATCEIETAYDTFGSPVVIWLIFQDAGGKELMKLALWPSLEDDRRLVKYVQAKLPKTKEDFWE
jgi:hypothetical protein